jgi:hypothetical protein
LENETDEVVSGVSTLSMAVERSGPLSFADICDLGAEVAGTLADQHDDGGVHGHVAIGSVVRLDDGPWRLAPSELVPDVEPVPAPELQGGAAPTPAGDVYALGAVLSYGLTGIVVEPVAPDAEAAPDADPEPVADAPAPGAVDAEPEPGSGRLGVDDDGEPTLELTADDLDRLRGFGGGPVDPAGPADEVDGDPEPIDLTDDPDDPDDAPMTLPEVMSSFLGVLRSSLAVDPADRPSAASLAATLRQLRSDADVALGGALVGAGAATVVIGDGAAGAEAWGEPVGDGADLSTAPPPPDPAPVTPPGELTVEGTGSAASLGAAAKKTKTKKSFKERAPMVVAVAAVLVAAFLGVSLARERSGDDADLLAVGPTQGTTVRRSTTSSTPALPVDLIVETTTTLPTSTTSSTSTSVVVVPDAVPDTTAPATTSTTEPPTTTTAPTTTTTVPGVPFKLAKVSCATPPKPENPCQLFEAADATSAPRSGPLPNGVNLQATCIKDGEPPFPGAVDTWLYIIGPAPTYSGWLSATHLGGSIPPVQPCQGTQTP